VGHQLVVHRHLHRELAPGRERRGQPLQERGMIRDPVQGGVAEDEIQLLPRSKTAMS